LRVKAAVTERSLSQIVNGAVKQSVAEDAEDLAAFKDRANEPNLAFEVVLKDLRQRTNEFALHCEAIGRQ